jgi:hypothetical protein
MYNFDNSNSSDKNSGKPMPFNNDSDEPSTFNNSDDTSISHSPLNLGGSSTIDIPKVKAAAETTGPAEKQPVGTTASTERITGVRTFFTKLHAGAIEFLDEQITDWLKNNPGITIKRTNAITGEIQGKKTEPNIIITVWY